jgi:hypothetical protein
VRRRGTATDQSLEDVLSDVEALVAEAVVVSLVPCRSARFTISTFSCDIARAVSRSGLS